MTTRTVFPSDAVDPIVHKLIYFWYGRGIFDEGGRWKETPLLEAARTGDGALVVVQLSENGCCCCRYVLIVLLGLLKLSLDFRLYTLIYTVPQQLFRLGR